MQGKKGRVEERRRRGSSLINSIRHGLLLPYIVLRVFDVHFEWARIHYAARCDNNNLGPRERFSFQDLEKDRDALLCARPPPFRPRCSFPFTSIDTREEWDVACNERAQSIRRRVTTWKSSASNRPFKLNTTIDLTAHARE